MHILRSLTINLQKRASDILTAYEHISDIMLELELLKTNCEEEFHSWFDEIKILADDLTIPVCTPRTAVRQVHRANVPADSPEVYYRSVMMPFLDHITNEMQARFGPIHQTKVKVLGLVPTIAPTYSLASIKEVSELYKTDLPSPQLLSTKYNRWKIRCTSIPLDQRPNSLKAALQYCDKDAFPNMYVLLVIACTLPVTTCETERSNSQLKLLKTYIRSTMTNEHLSDLAVIKVHHSKALTLINSW